MRVCKTDCCFRALRGFHRRFGNLHMSFVLVVVLDGVDEGDVGLGSPVGAAIA